MPRTLSQRTASSFTSGVRARGLAYLEAGRVRIESGTAASVDAVVRGTARYQVLIDWTEDRRLQAECDCPYFGDGALCKHIWAVLRGTERAGWLSAVPNGDSDLPVVAAFDGVPLDEDGEDGDGAYEDDDGEEEEDEHEGYEPTATRARVARRRAAPEPVPSWKALLDRIAPSASPAAASIPAGTVFVISRPPSRRVSEITMSARAGAPGSSGWRRAVHCLPSAADQIADPELRRALAALLGTVRPYHGYAPVQSFMVGAALAEVVLPGLCRSGRCFLDAPAPTTGEPAPLAWDDGEPWGLGVEIIEQGATWSLRGIVSRGDERVDLREVDLLLPALLVVGGRIAPLCHGDAAGIVEALGGGPMRIPAADRDHFLASIYGVPGLPKIVLPPGVTIDEVRFAPAPRVTVRPPTDAHRSRWLEASVAFDYDGCVIAARDRRRAAYDRELRRALLRDPDAERAHLATLAEHGFRSPARATWPRRNEGEEPDLELAAAKLPKVVAPLVAAGWRVEADGKVYRRPADFAIDVTSGIDWFDLQGSIDFEGVALALPRLLAAIRRRETTVLLDDGTLGLIPEEWLARYGLLADLGTVEAGAARFRRSQVGLLDALIASRPEVRCDRTFARLRAELQRFERIEPVEPPAAFTGKLRPYQRDGLAWLCFLQRFGFGGCLADDMGLGKTVQVLALLAGRRGSGRKGAARRPSLVVAPRSLIWNWTSEARRFAPSLAIVDHTGAGRARDADFTAADLVLTTYGTLRRDAAMFAEREFDYVVLDEAQAIKNPRSESSKAARLLRADHRLALSGTPVENHLGELWSIFEFLNPGMLGTSAAFERFGGGSRTELSEASRALLARALRPFLLRRTKGEVAKDLPARTEQTVYCEMDATQGELYAEVRDHYRASLLKRVALSGVKRSKIQILEALLRLRQAACHPGLLDASRKRAPSAKLEAAIEQIAEVVGEGHKALVFSQFTSLLAILRGRLDAEGIVYEYLDGKTRDRQARVDRFQTDPECRLFLISLKAGGLGLNLTAAEYVFLLDPWWNPAVEAQAIDRAHRIGQTRPVFAYRLICKDTIEEKIAEMQSSKRALAESVVRADAGLVSELSAEDLAALLS